MNGNPDMIGSVIAKSFYGNGNISWHYDRSLDSWVTSPITELPVTSKTFANPR